MPGWWSRLLGDRGERAACRYLRQQGFRILSRQYRTTLGEIDLICLDDECIVFVEVKSRSGEQAGHPVEAVDATKQKKLTDLALTYLKKHGLLEHRARFDVVTIVWPADRKDPLIQHFRNAFPPVGFGQLFS